MQGSFDEDKFAKGILLFRNAPRAGGAPPAQLVFGKPMRECLLAHRRSFAPEWQQPADVLEKTDPALKGKQRGALQPDHTGAAIA